MKSKTGFTLVELLIVITIVGILSGFIAVGMSGATNSAKDAVRKTDIEQLAKVITMYGIGNGGTYPVQSLTCNIGSNCANLSAALIPMQYKTFPRDPAGGYYTYYSLNGSEFTISSILSNSKLYSYGSSSGYYNSIVARSDQSLLYNKVNNIFRWSTGINVDDAANGSVSGYVVKFSAGWEAGSYLTNNYGLGAGTYDIYIRVRTDGTGNYPTSFNCAGVYDNTTSTYLFYNNLTGLTTSYQIKYFGRAIINGTDNIYTYFSCSGATTNYYLDYTEFRPV